jgi:hypothetical protein
VSWRGNTQHVWKIRPIQEQTNTIQYKRNQKPSLFIYCISVQLLDSLSTSSLVFCCRSTARKPLFPARELSNPSPKAQFSSAHRHHLPVPPWPLVSPHLISTTHKFSLAKSFHLTGGVGFTCWFGWVVRHHVRWGEELSSDVFRSGDGDDG